MPRVHSLTYRFSARVPEWWRLGESASSFHKIGGFECALTGSTLRVKPLGDYSTADAASRDFEPLLRRWLVQTEIEEQLALEFANAGADLVGDDGERIINANFTFSFSVAAAPVTKPQPANSVFYGLPHPADNFEEDALTAFLLDRLRALRQGESSMYHAYWALTALEDAYDGRDGISARLPVSGRVIDKLGTLSSWRRHPLHGRKGLNDEGAPLLSDYEHEWLLAVTEALVRITARRAAGALDGPKLTMAELPELDPAKRPYGT